MLDHSDMTPEELADLLNEDIDSVTTGFKLLLLLHQEEVEYIVEAVDEGLVVSLQVASLVFTSTYLTTSPLLRRSRHCSILISTTPRNRVRRLPLKLRGRKQKEMKRRRRSWWMGKRLLRILWEKRMN